MSNTPQIRFAGFTDTLPADRQVGNSRYTYVLMCDNGLLYKGKTNDIEGRIQEYLSGKGAKYTREHKPIALVYLKEFSTEKEAVEHRKHLKSGLGRKWLKEHLKNGRGCAK